MKKVFQIRFFLSEMNLPSLSGLCSETKTKPKFDLFKYCTTPKVVYCDQLWNHFILITMTKVTLKTLGSRVL